MNMNRNRLDDSFNFVAVVVAAVLAFGLCVSVSMDYALDRGSAQARADEHRAVNLAEAGAAAEKAAGMFRVAVANRP